MKITWLKRYALDRPWPYHVLLLAVFPVLFLYAYNIREMDFGQTLLPLALSLGGAALLWIVLTLVLRDARKAGLSAALFLFFFFSYGRFYEMLEKRDVLLPGHAYLLPGALLLWGYCVYFISRAKRDFCKTTGILNIIAVVLIAINLANILMYQFTKPKLATNEPVVSTGVVDNVTGASRSRPDIYFIILDEYAHPDTVKEWAGYDDSSFIRNLEDRGFYIASNSRTRTPYTTQAVAQVLNMEYLTAGWYWDAAEREWQEAAQGEFEYPDITPSSEPNYRKYACSKVSVLLKAEGYKYIYFGNWLATSRWEHYMKECADLCFNYDESEGVPFGTEFQNLLWNGTMLQPFYNYLSGNQYQVSYIRGVFSTLKHIKEMPALEGPKFVFAHIMCPHEPFIFKTNGEPVDPANYSNYQDSKYYRGQYAFISAEIINLVDSLLIKSKTPPIIILQSDHGLRPQHTGIVIGAEEWRKILNVLYLPGVEKGVLHESISPVNTFRVILNHYFNAGYGLLPDD